MPEPGPRPKRLQPGPAGPATSTAAAASAPADVPAAAPADRPAEAAAPAALPAPDDASSMDLVVAAEVIRRVTRTRQVVSLVSQVIIRAYDETALHAEVCRHLVSFGGYLMAWVGVAEERPERIVRPVAQSGLEPNFLKALKITWSNDLANRSPTSRAVLEQRPHVARNIPKEPRFAVLRQEAQLYGYTATCALPLQFAHHGMGVLTIHAGDANAFGPEEVALLRELSYDLAAGVIGLRERAKRQILEDRLVAVIDAADDAIIGTDAADVVTDWNEGATRMFGFQRSEAIGKTVAALLVPPEGLDEHRRNRQAVAGGERVERHETIRRCKEGRDIHTSSTVNPIFTADGEVIGATIVEHDVTATHIAAAAKRAVALEQLEVERLKGLEQVRRTFISAASHELNTPLTPLRLHVETLAERPDVTPGQRDHLVVIERNILRLASLVRDMLDASRLETGRFKLDLANVPLGLLVTDAVQGVAEAAAQAAVTLTESQALSNTTARADRDRISQVLHNLLTNAIAFTPPGGHIKVGCQMEKGAQAAIVRVADSGIGLSPDQVGLLFQPFSRPHAKNGPGPAGTGLGLFIAKGIVEQHGGRIWAESAGLGQGSTFSFSLPLADTGSPATSGRPARRPHAQAIPVGPRQKPGDPSSEVRHELEDHPR